MQTCTQSFVSWANTNSYAGDWQWQLMVSRLLCAARDILVRAIHI